MEWLNQAACLQEDPELFFPVGTGDPSLLQVEEAKEVCRRCFVRGDCLGWALDSGPDHGVCGGLDEEERRALKRRRLKVG
jgi:WhiB family redox-sensing transcriptional regulator